MPLMWKPIRGYEGLYEISEEGSIRSFRRTGTPTRILKSHMIRGYPYVSLCANNRKATKPVHRLLAIHFLSDPPSTRHQINHRDGVKSNNRVQNLEWVTPSENINHALKMGLIRGRPGESNPMSKATEHVVAQVKHLYGEGYRQRWIAKQFGFNQSQISRIINGKRWNHLFVQQEVKLCH